MNRDEVKSIVLYIVDNYNTERMEVTDDERMDELTEECCKVAARQSKGSAEQQPLTTQGSLEDSAQIAALLDGIDLDLLKRNNFIGTVTRIKQARQLLPC